jgi:hypothetical protein
MQPEKEMDLDWLDVFKNSYIYGSASLIQENIAE